MKVLNIRLFPDDVAAVQVLKRQGVNLSELARQAIRDAASRLKPSKQSAGKTIEQIAARHPIPDDAKPLGIDLTDRRAMSKYIRDKAK